MYPSSFGYEAPTSVRDAVELLASDEDAKALAGGQSLIPMLKLRFARPSMLVDLRRIEALHQVAVIDDHAYIGAMVPESVLVQGTDSLRSLPIIRDTAMVIADPLVRNSATLGGNLAHGDAENDHPATMIAIGARFDVVGVHGPREIAAGEFFRGLYETALDHADVLTAVRVPLPGPGSGSAYVKLRRQVGDFAIVAAAVSISADPQGFVESARIVFTGLDVVPVRAQEAESALVGSPLTEEAGATAARLCAETLDLDGSERSADYLSTAVEATALRAVRSAARRALEGS